MTESRHQAAPPSVISLPPRRFGAGGDLVTVPDPDVLTLGAQFGRVLDETGVIERVWTGAAWLEAPAWSAIGRHLIFSDTRNSRQHRYIWETGQVTVFRPESRSSNGNAFDHHGRLLVCEEDTRRVVRFEHDGTIVMIADSFEGQQLNSPNDVVAHPDGSVWFTDPPYGRRLAEGRPDAPGGQANPGGALNPRLGNETAVSTDSGYSHPSAVYRWDPSGRLEQVLDESDVPSPNGLAFSPDHRTVYVTSSGPAPAEPPVAPGDNAVHAFTLRDTRPVGGHVLFDMVIDGVQCKPDGMKVDVLGNLWCAASGPLGYAGVIVTDAEGRPIGRIRLPEVCPNLSFGGPRRNVVFLPATQSLYLLRVNVQGAGPS